MTLNLTKTKYLSTGEHERNLHLEVDTTKINEDGRHGSRTQDRINSGRSENLTMTGKLHCGIK
jgi:hypothetical protein